MDPLLLEGLAMPMLAQVEGLVGSGQRPLLALNGPVGAGKSRFCQQLIGLAKARGLRLAVASIDDAYLPGARARIRSRGCVRFSLTVADCRTDYTYHSLSAMVQTLRYFNDDDWTYSSARSGAQESD